MRSNYRQLEEFIEFAIEYDFNSVVFGIKNGPLVPSEDIFSMPDKRIMLYLENILSKIEKKCKDHCISLGCHFRSLVKRNEGIALEDKVDKGLRQTFKCKFPWMGLHITAESLGEVRPNCICGIGIGNITQQRILDIWNGNFMQQYRKEACEHSYQNMCSFCSENRMPENYLI